MMQVKGGKITRETLKLSAPVSYQRVAFYAVTFVAYRGMSAVMFDNCAYHSCTFVYDGMEVDFAEWMTLLSGPSEPEGKTDE